MSFIIILVIPWELMLIDNLLRNYKMIKIDEKIRQKIQADLAAAEQSRDLVTQQNLHTIQMAF